LTDTERDIATESRTENDALIEAAKLGAEAQILDSSSPGTVQVYAVPQGVRVEVVDQREYGDRPWRKTGTVTLHDAASFVAYVKRHQWAATMLYANRLASTVTAILNDHEDSSVEDAEGAGWGDHRAVLTLALTEEWKHWTGKNGQLLSQTAFAEHVEQGIEEITAPPAADMLDLAQHFEAHSRVAFKSVKILKDGQRQLTYDETIDAKAGQSGEVVIPKDFTLGIAPYEGTEPYQVTARLRYRIEGEALKIGYTLVRPHDVLKAAFTDVLDTIREGTTLTPLLGVHG
jgi:uncharacterized protein YfdQ (DUF2303 family)